MQRIYFDNAATTPLIPEVVEVMTQTLSENFGNPSSIHFYGRNAKAAVEEARRNIAKMFNCSIGDIFFTSSATESNNLIIHGAIKDLGVKRIITSPTEHPCVLKAIEQCDAEVEVVFLKVDQQGKIKLEELAAQLESETKTLVSLMYVNNELGTTIPISEISNLCQEKGALFHSDTVQAIGKLPLDLDALPINFISASAHKFHGPKGIGFVFINGNNQITPAMLGGAQERNMRAGTENIAGIVGMAKALELAFAELETRKKYILEIREHFLKEIKKLIPDLRVNGDLETGIHHILNLSFPESNFSDLMMFNLDINGVCASAGSACSSGISKDSSVLEAIGHDPKRKAIRFSFSHLNTKQEVDLAIERIASFINK